MLDRRTLLKFFPLAALLERIIASIRAKPAVVQPLDMADQVQWWMGEAARLEKQPLFEVIPVDGVSSRFAPVVRVCNDGVNNFVQVVSNVDPGRIMATFPYDERSKKRAVGMACNFVRSNSWCVFDCAEAIREHEELLGPERVAKRDEILKRYAATIKGMFEGPTV